MDPQQRMLLETAYHALENGMEETNFTQIGPLPIAYNVQLVSLLKVSRGPRPACFRGQWRATTIE